MRICGSVFFRGRCAVLERGLRFVGRSERQIRALISEFRGPC